MNKTEVSGLTILFIGVALLIFTFLNAYWFLTQNIGLIATGDLVKAFGEALAPLIETCIRIMYLGIMGWIGSLLTLRGISLLTHKEKAPPTKIEKTPQQKPPAETTKETPKTQVETKPQKTEEEQAKQAADTKPTEQPTQEPAKTTEQREPAEEKEKKEKGPENVNVQQSPPTQKSSGL